MICFNHNENQAIGICKHCSKGICVTCATDLGDGLACTQTCVEEVREINKLINHNKKAFLSPKSSFTFTGVFYVAFGAVFLIVPIIYYKRIDPFPLLLGGLLAAFGTYTLFKNKN